MKSCVETRSPAFAKSGALTKSSITLSVDNCKVVSAVIASVALTGTPATAKGIALYEHTVASSAGGTALWKYYTPLVSGDGANVVFTIPMYIEISAGNYINFQHDSGLIRESMLVLECDA